MMTRPTTDPRRRTLLIFLFVMAFQQGVTINLLPVLFTNFAETFQLDLQQRGQIQSFFFVGAMAALFASGFVTERIAVRRSALLALGLSGLGSILVAVAPDFLLLRLGAMVLGMGTLWVLSVTSATIAAHFAPQSQRLFMWTMAVFAASGTGAPYGLGHLVSFLGAWRPILFGVGLYLWVSALAITLLFSGSLRDTGLRARLPGPRPDGDSLGSGPLRTAPAGWLAGIVRRYRGSLLGQGALLLIGFLVVLDNLTAGNIVAWTPNLCELRFGRSTALAGEIMGANSVGYLAGRVILGLFLTGRYSDRVLLGLCYAGGMLAYSLLLWVPDPSMAIAMMVLQGVFLSAQAPTVYSLASSKFADRAGTAVPLVDAIGTIGAIPAPPLMGWVAQRMGGLEQAAWLIPLTGCLLVAISLGWEVRDRSAKQRHG